MSAAKAGDRISEEVDKKFGEVIHLLSSFEKEFPGGFKDARSGLLGERRRMELTVRGYGPLVL